MLPRREPLRLLDDITTAHDLHPSVPKSGCFPSDHAHSSPALQTIVLRDCTKVSNAGVRAVSDGCHHVRHVDLRGAEAGRFQNSFFDHFLSAAATATSQVGRGYAGGGTGAFVSTLAARINTHALRHAHVCVQTLETQSYSTPTASH